MADRLPLLRNVRWVQVAFGALAGALGYRLWRHFTGAETLSGGGLALAILGLALSLFVFVIYLQNVYRFGLVPDYSKKCRFCNGPVNRYSEFCEHCGADLIAEEKLVKCGGCGADVYEGTKFCPECGSAVARPARDKGKKGHKKRRETEAQGAPSEIGWSTPLDAAGGFPPPEERR